MVVIIDYNAGNTKSVFNAIDRLGADVLISADKDLIMKAEKVILPGVGHANNAMHELHKRDLIKTIKEVKVPFLGICIGMHLLMDWSEEGNTPCLGIIKGEVKKFKGENCKIPKIGWNTVSTDNDALFSSIINDNYFYFVHSYFISINENSIGTSRYIEDYTSVIKKDNYYGVQFHPEKSGKTGSQFIQNFLTL
jgi:imidazole glycerol-phosphate synthase subunit HisH